MVGFAETFSHSEWRQFAWYKRDQHWHLHKLFWVVHGEFANILTTLAQILLFLFTVG
jgi:hypothetical protein